MNRLATIKFALLALVCATAAMLQPVYASSYGFTKITSNSSYDLGNQLSLTVTPESYGEGAIFTIRNNVGTPSSVSQIYFDDTLGLLGSMDFNESSANGVSFSNIASPSNLPGGNAFAFSADYGFGAAPPPPKNGISDASEWVSFVGFWASGANFNSLLDAIASGGFRVGLHVISIGGSGGTSDSYISAVPLPAAFWLFGSALIGFVTLSNRRKI